MTTEHPSAHDISSPNLRCTLPATAQDLLLTRNRLFGLVTAQMKTSMFGDGQGLLAFEVIQEEQALVLYGVVGEGTFLTFGEQAFTDLLQAWCTAALGVRFSEVQLHHVPETTEQTGMPVPETPGWLLGRLTEALAAALFDNDAVSLDESGTRDLASELLDVVVSLIDPTEYARLKAYINLPVHTVYVAVSRPGLDGNGEPDGGLGEMQWREDLAGARAEYERMERELWESGEHGSVVLFSHDTGLSIPDEITDEIDDDLDVLTDDPGTRLLFSESRNRS